MEPPPSRRRAVVVASPSLIAHYERFIDYLKTGGYHDFLQRLVERMKASPGQLVPYGVDDRDWALMEAAPEDVTLAAGPDRIAILTDQHVVSAGEAFLLSAGRSPKVTIFGRNSAGSIDYESVYMTIVRGDGFRLRLGLPSVAGSDTLPAGGLNDAGVPVDVELDPDAPDAFEPTAYPSAASQPGASSRHTPSGAIMRRRSLSSAAIRSTPSSRAQAVAVQPRKRRKSRAICGWSK